MSFFYLASPFSQYSGGHQAAVVVAAEATALLFRAGVTVFSPIVHGYGLVKWGGVQGTDFEYWRIANHRMIKASAGLILLTVDGYTESKGIADELTYCSEIGRAVIPMRPGAIPGPLAHHTDNWPERRLQHVGPL